MTSKWNGAPGATRGPWFVSTDPVLAIVAQENNPVIAEITAVDDGPDRGIEIANAHQIAASGALYDATELLDSLCAWMLHRFGPDSPEGREASLRQAKAIAALALARGEAS